MIEISILTLCMIIYHTIALLIFIGLFWHGFSNNNTKNGVLAGLLFGILWPFLIIIGYVELKDSL